jgi:PilZ domain
VQSSQKSHGKSASKSAERRANPRHAFVATTEITDSAHALRLSGRVTEISRQGCFVDVVHPLPVGTILKLRVTCDQGSFETRAKILYVQRGIGMGVVFVDTAEDQVKILEKWLVDLPPDITA